MRQSCLWEADVSTPEKFKVSLKNPAKRRRYILDADVEVATLSNLVYNAHPKTGKVNEERDGKRRIDYVLYNKDVNVVSTVKLSYSKHCYNKFMLIVKSSFFLLNCKMYLLLIKCNKLYLY